MASNPATRPSRVSEAAVEVGTEVALPASAPSGFHPLSVRGEPGAIAAGYDACNPTHVAPTLSRNDMGAELMASDDTVSSLNRATHWDSTKRGGPAVAVDALSLLLLCSPLKLNLTIVGVGRLNKKCPGVFSSGAWCQTLHPAVGGFTQAAAQVRSPQH
jgi:hypothetical protein